MATFHTAHTQGSIEVICGCMFSGKTEALITQIRRAEIARLRYQLFKPLVDKRYSETEVASHDQTRIPAINLRHPNEAFHHVDAYTHVVGFDEAQFFDASIVDVVTRLAESGRRVIVAGLDTDWQGLPFGPMPDLLAVADVIHKQYAICVICGTQATRTQRLVSGDEQFLLGSTESYEARCRKHFDPTLSLRLRKEQHNSLDFSSEMHQTSTHGRA